MLISAPKLGGGEGEARKNAQVIAVDEVSLSYVPPMGNEHCPPGGRRRCGHRCGDNRGWVFEAVCVCFGKLKAE